jgi:hypothetical protein
MMTSGFEVLPPDPPPPGLVGVAACPAASRGYRRSRLIRRNRGPGADPPRSEGEVIRVRYAVATAGDVNGDGFSDVVVGARHQNGQAGVDAGLVRLYLAWPPVWHHARVDGRGDRAGVCSGVVACAET